MSARAENLLESPPKPEKLADAQVAPVAREKDLARSAASPAGEPPKKRGRPAGSKTKLKSALTPDAALEDLVKRAQKWKGTLAMISAGFVISGAEKIELDGSDPIAEAWCVSAQQVEDEYGEIPYLSLVTLVGCTVVLCGPRVYDVMEKRAAAKKKQEPATEAKEKKDTSGKKEKTAEKAA